MQILNEIAGRLKKESDKCKLEINGLNGLI